MSRCAQFFVWGAQAASLQHSAASPNAPLREAQIQLQ